MLELWQFSQIEVKKNVFVVFAVRVCVCFKHFNQWDLFL